jgi:hypothetical protein
MLLLAWIVVCDDSPGEEKPAAFAQLATHLGVAPSIALLLNIAKGSCLRSLQLASEIIQLSILPQNKDATMDVCISLAAADNYLSISENLILRYVARLLGRDYPLRSRYLAVTGTNLPAVGDPSLANRIDIGMYYATAPSWFGECYSASVQTATPRDNFTNDFGLQCFSIVVLQMPNFNQRGVE